MTAIPLYLYCKGIKSTPLSVVGFIQYLNPTLNLIVAVYLFKEPFTEVQLTAFCFIWLGIAVFLIEPIANVFKKQRLKFNLGEI